MANRLTVKIKDATKTAFAKETVALCGCYDVEVEPSFDGEGKLVLYRSVPETAAMVFPGEATGTSNFDVKAADWKKNPVYAVFDLVDGKTVKPLDLGVKGIVEDFTRQYAPESIANLRFAVYSNANGGLLGSGDMMLKVVEPYRAADDQDFCNWRGAKGEDGRTVVPEIAIGTVENVSSEGDASASIRNATDDDGNPIEGKYLLDLKLKQGIEGFCNIGSRGDGSGDNVSVTAFVVGNANYDGSGFPPGSIHLKANNSAKGSNGLCSDTSQITSKSSISMGNKCYTFGNTGGIAVGHWCTAGAFDTAGDYSADFEGTPGIAVGSDCISCGDGSIAAGRLNEVIGKVGCIAVGWSNKIGKATISRTNGLNITEIDDGDGKFCSGAFGYNNEVQEHYSYAFGLNNTAFGYASIAIGESNDATGSHAVAIGYNNAAAETSGHTCVVAIGQDNNAHGIQSVAIGANNNTGKKIWNAETGEYEDVDADRSFAIGIGCKAEHEDSFAIGHGAETEKDGDFAICSKGNLSIKADRFSVAAKGDVAVNAKGCISLAPNSSSASYDKDPVDFINIGDLTLRQAIRKYAQLTDRDYPAFSFTTLDDGLTHRITLKYEDREQHLDVKDAVLTPYAQECCAGEWNVEVVGYDEFIDRESVRIDIEWREEEEEDGYSRTGWYCEVDFVAAENEREYEEGQTWTHQACEFISEDINLDRVERRISILNQNQVEKWIDIKATRRVYAGKGDAYVTAGYVDKRITEAVGTALHALAPETSDTTLTLNPVDGKANWVEDVLSGLAGSGWSVQVGAYLESVEDSSVFSRPEYTAEYGKDVVIRYNGSEFEMEWLHDVTVEGCTFKAGIYPYTYTGSSDLTNLYFDGFSIDGFVEIDHPWMLTTMWAECSKNEPDLEHVFVMLPSATGHARRFSLALETDAESEREVAWNGGTVVEKFPGASKLAVGRTVWDVKEVAPDEFLVDRAPGASGISLTGANGKAYTLGVDGDGVIEVKAD